jgi:hypothetical protein
MRLSFSRNHTAIRLRQRPEAGICHPSAMSTYSTARPRCHTDRTSRYRDGSKRLPRARRRPMESPMRRDGPPASLRDRAKRTWMCVSTQAKARRGTRWQIARIARATTRVTFRCPRDHLVVHEAHGHMLSDGLHVGGPFLRTGARRRGSRLVPADAAQKFTVLSLCSHGLYSAARLASVAQMAGDAERWCRLRQACRATLKGGVQLR